MAQLLLNLYFTNPDHSRDILMNIITKLMNSLSLSKKMLLIALLFLLPLIYTTTIVIIDESAGIKSAYREHDGLEYIRIISQLYKDLPQHRGMTNAYRNGKEEFKAKALQKRKDISADIAAINAAEELYGKRFKTTKLWTEIKLDWQQLEAKAFDANPKTVFDDHTALIKKVAGLYEVIGNNSGLVLDSELDSYHVIQVLLVNLPVITERLGRARGLGSGIAAHGEISTLQQVSIEMLLDEVRTNSESATHHLELIVDHHPEIIAQLDSILKQRNLATDLFIETVKKELEEAIKIQISPSEVFSLGTQAIKANFQLYDILIPVLDGLFQKRIDHLSHERNIIVGLILFSILVAVLLFIGFYNSMITNIRQLSKATKTVSEGNLTVKVDSDSQDETSRIVDSLNTMVVKLNETITNIGSTSSLLSNSAGQLSTTTKTVSSNIGEQQEQTEQIATAMNEMTATVQDIARNAELLAAEVSLAETETTAGSTIINETIAAINTLADGVGDASNVVAKLEDSSNEIGSILNVIKGVAEQTNLLALNAAIEAARAGEHGRGFAVVADEVRTLATRTQESAEQIQEMVASLQSNTRHAASVMNDEREKAEKMSLNTQEATSSLERIVSSMTKISDMSVQVATAAEQQGCVSEEINRNVTLVSNLSSENMLGTQDVSTASTELSELATELDGVVKKFKV